MTLLDTGPLVALIDQRERHHEWAVEAFAAVGPELLTCEAVLAETGFLLRSRPDLFDALLLEVEAGRLGVEAMAREVGRLRQLVRKYRSVPMSFADACMVRLSELHRAAQLMTLDRDFELYRRDGRGVIPLVAPWRA